jgi:hypothetical protein
VVLEVVTTERTKAPELQGFRRTCRARIHQRSGE